MRSFNDYAILFTRSHILSRHEREVNEFRKLEREKSFDEARTAVQSQIEKIFQKKVVGSTSTASNSPLVNNKSRTAASGKPPARLSRKDLQTQNDVSSPGKGATNVNNMNNNNNNNRRYPSHGVSHLTPDQMNSLVRRHPAKHQTAENNHPQVNCISA